MKSNRKVLRTILRLIYYESNQNNTGYISRNNAEDQGLVVATLVESDRNVFQMDVIVDAFLVEENPDRENPTPWYKDRRNIVFGIIVIVVASIAVIVTSQLLGDGDIGDDVVDVLQSVAPSIFHSNIFQQGGLVLSLHTFQHMLPV